MSYARSTKRQYQPSISSYFQRSSTPSPHPPTARKHHEDVILPDQVQASLIQVGMRVRKAVPEGYQTKDKSTYTPEAASRPSVAVAEPPRTTHYRHPRPAELAPFCGIHKIGGYDAQTFYPDDGESDFPGSSQDSFQSTVSIDSVPDRARSSGTANTRKRGMLDEEEGDDGAATDAVLDPAYFDSHLWQAGVFEREGHMAGLAQRPIAQAVSRRKGAGFSTSLEDFEDAGFLHPLDATGDEDMMMG